MGNLIYVEKLTSKVTETLFIVLTLLFTSLSVWRIAKDDFKVLTIVFVFFSIFFLFYAINYKTLHISMTSESLILTFGIFKWAISYSDIEACYLDDMYTRLIGGAGIHFMFVQGKYRSYFNFLEYPRVFLILKKKKGPVAEIAFSTKRPYDVMHILEERIVKEEN
jgi:hypothetical protein